MAEVTLEQVVEAVKALEPEEQRRLREALDGMLAEPAATEEPQARAGEENVPRMTEEEFERFLVEKGILSRVRPPMKDLSAYKDRKPVKIKGKPLSETIIEDRR